MREKLRGAFEEYRKVFAIIFMITKYKHISFDLDGTLVHTISEYRHKIVPEVVSQLGGKIPDNDSIDRFWFGAGRDFFIEKELGLKPILFWNLFRKMDSPQNRSLYTEAYNDSERALKRLKKMGKIISILTGAPHNIAQMEIEKLNNAPHDFYISIHDSEFDEKPDPASLNFAIKKLSVKPQETIYIGNGVEDAYFAKKAGVGFIHLKRKEHYLDLKDYAVATIKSLDELFI